MKTYIRNINDENSIFIGDYDLDQIEKIAKDITIRPFYMGDNEQYGVTDVDIRYYYNNILSTFSVEILFVLDIDE